MSGENVHGISDGHGKHIDPAPWCKTDADRNFLVLCQVVDLIVSVLFRIRICLAHRGRFRRQVSDASRSVTGKKRTAQFLFQFEKLLVKRRLGDKKLFGGVGDIFLRRF